MSRQGCITTVFRGKCKGLARNQGYIMSQWFKLEGSKLGLDENVENIFIQL